MINLDIDAYTATFEQLASAVGWEANTQGTINKFANGLKDNVHQHILNQETEPTTMTEWMEAGHKET